LPDNFNILNAQYAPIFGDPVIAGDTIFFPTINFLFSNLTNGSSDQQSGTIAFDISVNSGLQLSSIVLSFFGTFGLTGIGSSGGVTTTFQVQENIDFLRAFNSSVPTVPSSPVVVTSSSGDLVGNYTGDLSLSVPMSFPANNLHFSLTMILDGFAAIGGTTDFSVTFLSLAFTFEPDQSPPNPSIKNISIVQSNNISPLSKHDFISIVSKKISNIIPFHSATQYQIYENHVPLSGNPIVNLTSGHNIRTNGNVTKLTKDELNIILKNNTAYKIRARFKGSNGWSQWTKLQKFRTRNKDYKYIRSEKN